MRHYKKAASNGPTDFDKHIIHSNIDVYMSQKMLLLSSGLGLSPKDVDELDTDEFLDMLEYIELKGYNEAYNIYMSRNQE